LVFNVILISLNQCEAYHLVCSSVKFHPRQIVAFQGRRTRVCEVHRLNGNYAVYFHMQKVYKSENISSNDIRLHYIIVIYSGIM